MQNIIYSKDHKSINKPWGFYAVISEGERYKVKIIEIDPYKRLSLQRHDFRSEHWVIVKGEAKITNGRSIYYLGSDESIYIPKGSIHRIENQGSAPLRVIETQCGGYLEEDDIERLEDDFGR